MLGWLGRDAKLVYTCRFLRTLGHTFVSIFLAVYLRVIGVELVPIGFLLTASFLSGALSIASVGFFADRFGRRRMLIILSGFTALSGLLYALTVDYRLLFLASVLGQVGTTGATGAYVAEQVVLAQSVSDKKRTTAFSYFSLLGSAATSLGALASGMPARLQPILGFSEIYLYQLMFALFSLLNLISMFVYSLLSSRSELRTESRAKKQPLSTSSKRILALLSILFGVDSLAGGLVSRSLVSYWFYTRFGLRLGSISLIFFVSSIFAAISFLIAPKIAERIGLIRTMVFTHLPASLMLTAIFFAPTLPLALALYLGRQLIQSMDVPTRESYIMAIVKPHERTRASGITSFARYPSAAIAPAIAAYLMQNMSLSIPFALAGILKILYDLSLYVCFRNIRPPEEDSARTAR